MKYALVTDSCCELTEELLESLDAKSVPLRMTLGEKEYVDDGSMDIDGFLKEIGSAASVPKSSCPSPADFADAFLAAKGDVVFCVTLSSKLSGSYASARLAKDIAAEKGKEAHVFDSERASAGELLTALKIKEFIDAGLGTEEIVAKTEAFIKTFRTFFVLENTEIMTKNGRMNAFLGKALDMLNIRLILGSDGEGNVKLFSKTRGSQAALKKLADTVAENCRDAENSTLVITHCFNPAGAQQVGKIAGEACSFKQVVIRPTGGLSSMYASRGGIITAF